MPRKLTKKTFVKTKDGAAILAESQDTAVRLLAEIKEHRLDPADLSAQQRRACILLLSTSGKNTGGQMARMLGCSLTTVRRDLKKIREEVGREVREWSLEAVVGQLALAKERCAAQAMAQEDPGLAWSIERDWVKSLKELGVVAREEERDGLRITIEALGQGYEHARKVLAQGLDPRLTGMIVEDHRDEDVIAPPPLALEHRIPSGEDDVLEASYTTP